ncbi:MULTISPECIES: hypothetical protein [Chryseobacterium]|jgi:hypothetical protein|uniref:Helix-turn-helix domain-containing protein n=5 Tax=Chryseobacterium TaxID=59732 RepID=A0AAD1DMD2_9FLAO|nr:MULTISPECIES: hypothetical protein [Chryseobacterium]AZA88547.1 hypothetical protein EG349_18095 [Chryseobacterium shandongense]AZA97089.1 hypothetical protein EG353_16795 [Chryseobacterium shandongense]KFF27033.1 hypothetical protein IW16_07150 [Chryseobacterium vrystaatense]MEC3874924.1 hypothetical protein [Chryseobacterium sp. T9W2-O]SIO33961.1 hypothetical protein SAMN05421769_3660 [Chryseobacterium scophthalmum]
MTYLELIHRFWDFNKINQIGSTGISMYLYLLKIGYDNNGYEFQISDVAVSKELGLTRKTVKSVKEKLQNFGLIEFQTKNGLPCYYRLLLDYPLKIAKPEKIKKAKIVKSSDFLTAGSVEIPSQQQPSPPVINQKNIPSFDEFIEYAQTLETYESELDSVIEKKYEVWVRNDWQNSSNRRITNWKSSLKSILPFIKNEDTNLQLSVSSIPNIKRPKNPDRK